MCKGSERQGKKKMNRERGIEINPAVCDFVRKCNQLFSQLGYLWISCVNHHIWKLSLKQEWGWGGSENNLCGSSVSLVKPAPWAMNSPHTNTTWLYQPSSSTQSPEKTQLPQFGPGQCLGTVVSVFQLRLSGPVVMTQLNFITPKCVSQSQGCLSQEQRQVHS